VLRRVDDLGPEDSVTVGECWHAVRRGGTTNLLVRGAADVAFSLDLQEQVEERSGQAAVGGKSEVVL
jgi:hypothetical protein